MLDKIILLPSHFSTQTFHTISAHYLQLHPPVLEGAFVCVCVCLCARAYKNISVEFITLVYTSLSTSSFTDLRGFATCCVCSWCETLIYKFLHHLR